jgi:hypothetical protein
MDNFLCEIHKATWDFVGPNLLQVYKEAIRKQMLGASINQGIIKFITATRDLKLITSWRPITLLNTQYKILAKVLALCIEHILPRIIRSRQTDFIRGKYILRQCLCFVGRYGMGLCLKA